ncbi:MAG: hypothetical protein J7K00_00155 [Candidatus Diapherotrites archaeon]|nr:hypothetical protein [Candidatus Diapherotrites archaeon]
MKKSNNPDEATGKSLPFNRVDAVSLLILFTLNLAAISKSAFFLVSDQWERAATVAEIIRTTSFPFLNFTYGQPITHIYSPLFDVFSAQLSILSGLDVSVVWMVMSFFFIASFYFISRRIADRFIKNPMSSRLTGLVVCLLPWVLMRSFAPIPETVGLLLFLTAVLFFIESNPVQFAVILVPLVLFHGRSFLSVSGLVLIFFAADMFKGQKPSKAFLFGIGLAALATSFWWVPIFGEILSVNPLENPWISEYNPLMLFGAAAVFAFFGLLSAHSRKGYLKYAWIWILAAYAMYVVGEVTGKNILKFRELAYGFFPVAFFSVLFLMRSGRFGSKICKNENMQLFKLKKYSTAVFLTLMLFSSAWIITSRYPPIDDFDCSAMSAMASATGFEDGIVLAGFTPGYGIPVISGKKIVIGPFMEQLPDSQERLFDANLFFEDPGPGNGKGNADRILEKYNANLVYVSRSETLKFGSQKIKMLDANQNLNKLIENPYSKVYSFNPLKQITPETNKKAKNPKVI